MSLPVRLTTISAQPCDAAVARLATDPLTLWCRKRLATVTPPAMAVLVERLHKKKKNESRKFWFTRTQTIPIHFVGSRVMLTYSLFKDLL